MRTRLWRSLRVSRRSSRLPERCGSFLRARATGRARVSSRSSDRAACIAGPTEVSRRMQLRSFHEFAALRSIRSPRLYKEVLMAPPDTRVLIMEEHSPVGAALHAWIGAQPGLAV